MDWDKITEEILYDAINRLLNDPAYKLTVSYFEIMSFFKNK